MRSLLWLSIALIFFAIPSLALENHKNGILAFEQGDYETALIEFKTLAKQNDSLGQYGLGLMYDLGTGVSINFKEAVKWYQLSADQGNSDAQNNLATMYAEGEGVIKDVIKAKKLYESAAQQGNFDSPNNIGTMYLQGIDITRNYVKAYMWFHLGEMKGDRGAKQNRAFVETKMTPEEIIEANKMAGEWIQRYVGF
jgi:TPR repeat protein